MDICELIKISVLRIQFQMFQESTGHESAVKEFVVMKTLWLTLLTAAFRWLLGGSLK